MLIKVTNYCSFGCSHCMEESTVAGKHMLFDTFLKALEFTKRAEELAWSSGAIPFILLSGGEPTEHPEIEKFIAQVFADELHPVLISNGSFLENEELKKSILRPEWEHLSIQVTNDPRFYPRRVPASDDPRIVFIPSLNHILPLGRIVGKKTDLPTKKAPSSYNVRSVTTHFGDLRKALALIRMKAMMGFSGHCSPSISSEGDILAGESRNCGKVGTVDSTIEDVTKNIMNLKCNKCGLEDNLTLEQKRAIGLTVLFSPSE